MRAALTLAVLSLAGSTALFAQGRERETMAPFSRIVEVVRASDGTPVEGASVEAWGASRGTVVKRTGSDGTARFDGLPRKRIVFVARLPGHLCGWHEPGRWWWSMPEEDTDPDGDGVTRMKLALTPGTVVEGLVLAPDGEPIEGATVEAHEVAHATDLWTLRGAPFWTAKTDADGRFRTSANWPAPKREVGKLVSAVVRARGVGWIHEKTEIWPANAGKQESLLFRLRPAGEIHGTVIGADGEPAAGAEVHAYPPDFWAFSTGRRNDRDTHETHPREMHVRSGPAGEYSLPEAFPGVRYRIFAEVSARDPDSSIGSMEVVARSAVTAGLGIDRRLERVKADIRVRRLGSLTVRLAPGAGGDAERSRIRLVPPPDARPWVHDREKDGVVTVAQADAGEWTIEADAVGWLRRRTVVSLEEGEEKTVEVRLDRGAAVEGVVVDDAGDPVSGATLHAWVVNPEVPTRYLPGYEEGKSDRAGRFKLTGLRPGPTDLSVGHDRLRSDGYTRVTAPATDVRLVLHATASLRFRLLFAPGAAAPEHVRVTVTRLDGPTRGTQRQEVASRKDDAYLLENVMPGPVSFAVEARGYAPFLTRLSIRPGVLNEPEPFALPVGFTLRGRIIDRTGKGVAGARILAWGNEENAVLTDGEGGFAIPHMLAGKVDLSVKAEGMAEALLTPRISIDRPPLAITISPGGLVRGTLADPEGREFPGSMDFYPAAAKDDNVSKWRAEAKDGVFSIRLPAGRYRCAGRLAGEKRGPTEFDVEEGGEVVLDLVVQ